MFSWVYDSANALLERILHLAYQALDLRRHLINTTGRFQALVVSHR